MKNIIYFYKSYFKLLKKDELNALLTANNSVIQNNNDNKITQQPTITITTDNKTSNHPTFNEQRRNSASKLFTNLRHLLTFSPFSTSPTSSSNSDSNSNSSTTSSNQSNSKEMPFQQQPQQNFIQQQYQQEPNIDFNLNDSSSNFNNQPNNFVYNNNINMNSNNNMNNFNFNNTLAYPAVGPSLIHAKFAYNPNVLYENLQKNTVILNNINNIKIVDDNSDLDLIANNKNDQDKDLGYHIEEFSRIKIEDIEELNDLVNNNNNTTNNNNNNSSTLSSPSNSLGFNLFKKSDEQQQNTNRSNNIVNKFFSHIFGTSNSNNKENNNNNVNNSINNNINNSLNNSNTSNELNIDSSLLNDVNIDDDLMLQLIQGSSNNENKDDKLEDESILLLRTSNNNNNQQDVINYQLNQIQQLQHDYEMRIVTLESSLNDKELYIEDIILAKNNNINNNNNNSIVLDVNTTNSTLNEFNNSKLSALSSPAPSQESPSISPSISPASFTHLTYSTSAPSSFYFSSNFNNSNSANLFLYDQNSNHSTTSNVSNQSSTRPYARSKVIDIKPAENINDWNNISITLPNFGNFEKKRLNKNNKPIGSPIPSTMTHLLKSKRINAAKRKINDPNRDKLDNLRINSVRNLDEINEEAELSSTSYSTINSITKKSNKIIIDENNNSNQSQLMPLLISKPRNNSISEPIKIEPHSFDVNLMSNPYENFNFMSTSIADPLSIDTTNAGLNSNIPLSNWFERLATSAPTNFDNLNSLLSHNNGASLNNLINDGSNDANEDEEEDEEEDKLGKIIKFEPDKQGIFYF